MPRCSCLWDDSRPIGDNTWVAGELASAGELPGELARRAEGTADGKFQAQMDVEARAIASLLR